MWVIKSPCILQMPKTKKKKKSTTRLQEKFFLRLEGTEGSGWSFYGTIQEEGEKPHLSLVWKIKWVRIYRHFWFICKSNGGWYLHQGSWEPEVRMGWELEFWRIGFCSTRAWLGFTRWGLPSEVTLCSWRSNISFLNLFREAVTQLELLHLLVPWNTDVLVNFSPKTKRKLPF